MTTSQPAIKTILQQAITEAQNKSADAAAGSNMQKTTAEIAKQKQEAIRVKESVLDAKQMDLDTVRDSLQNPPQKEVSTGKNKTKTVVDDQEVAKLKQNEKLSLQQVNQAKADVETARGDAASAATEALQAAGVSQELQNQMGSLLEKVDAIKDSLDSGGKVEDDKIKEVVDEFNQISGQVTGAMNKGKLISQAFFEPIKKGFQDIQKALNLQAAQAETNSQTQNTNGTNTQTTNTTENSTDSTNTSTNSTTNDDNDNDSISSDANQQEAALVG